MRDRMEFCFLRPYTIVFSSEPSLIPFLLRELALEDLMSSEGIVFSVVEAVEGKSWLLCCLGTLGFLDKPQNIEPKKDFSLFDEVEVDTSLIGWLATCFSSKILFLKVKLVIGRSFFSRDLDFFRSYVLEKVLKNGSWDLALLMWLKLLLGPITLFSPPLL